jgi:hypothetical protein
MNQLREAGLRIETLAVLMSARRVIARNAPGTKAALPNRARCLVPGELLLRKPQANLRAR